MRGGALAAAGVLILLGLSAARGLTRRRTQPSAEVPHDPGRAVLGTVPPGTVLGSNYRVVREVGRGGMGVVYESFDQALERRVAVKQLRRELCVRPEERDLFLREARLVAKLKHPNIVEIHAVIDEGELYLVFDFVEGKTLAETLAGRGRLPIPEASGILQGAAAAVGFAHGREIVHRDLKPSNIMMAADGSARVMDFGIARQSRSLSCPTLTSVAGTPQYMAPEAEFGAASRESDLYSLGIVAYEMVTGAFPFPGPDLRGQKAAGEFTPASARASALPKALDAFFSKALKPSPEARFPDAARFVSAFRQAVG
ncbi:MAG: serine/threonine protein kinase [Elusimicrobia bacterium]|nr:serine/threonine protein kinase [Elusimicrobiota bacterium]